MRSFSDMITTIRHELRTLDVSGKALRSFGYAVGAVLVGIAAIVCWRSGWPPGPVAYGLAGAGGLLLFAGLVAPVALRPVYRAWMVLAFVLGYVMTRVVLTLVYYLLVTPIGLVRRALGKDPVRGPDRSVSTYWIARDDASSSPARLEKYY